jgi:hypothetical protein
MAEQKKWVSILEHSPLGAWFSKPGDIKEFALLRICFSPYSIKGEREMDETNV